MKTTSNSHPASVALAAVLLAVGAAACGDGRTGRGGGGTERDSGSSEDGSTLPDGGTGMDGATPDAGPADGGAPLDGATDAGPADASTDASMDAATDAPVDAGPACTPADMTDAGDPPTSCPQAAPVVLTCGICAVMADTADGAANLSDYTPCTTSTSYAGKERVLAFRSGVRATVTITATRGSSGEDFDLFVLEGGDGTEACGAPGSCLDASRAGRSTATEEVTFGADPAHVYYVVYDVYNNDTATTDFTVEVACDPIECGDGMVEAPETCDDGNRMDGDGCSADCAVEDGFLCDDSAPSVCHRIVCGDGRIEGTEVCDDGNRMDGDGCSADCAVEDGFLCDDSAPSVCHRIVCGDGRVEATEVCDDGNRDDGDGCSASCAVEDGYTCVGEPSYCRRVVRSTGACVDTSSATALGVTMDDAASGIETLPFSLDFFGATVTHFSVASNGFMQFWTDTTGTPDDSAGNDPIPSTLDPDGYVAPFWDDLAPPDGGSADVFTMTTGDAGSRTFVVEWRGWTFYSSSTSASPHDETVTVQAVLEEATGAIEFRYCTLDPGSHTPERVTGDSATIGIENMDGTEGIQVAYDTAMSVDEGDIVRIAP